MIEFFQALRDPSSAFLLNALVVGLLSSVSLGVIGSYVVTRRITYIAAAISHCVLGGIGAALWLNVVCGCRWCDPMLGGTLAALASALLIGLVSLYARQREDTVISAVWAVGMAVGLLFFAKTPGYVDPMSYLFGNILLISHDDVWRVAGMDFLVVAIGVGFYPKLLAICFDEEFAELRGARVKAWYLVLLCLTALTVVLLVRVVGVVLVIALLTLPAAVAGHFARRLWQMMLLATLCCMAFVTLGLALSYPADLPSGPVIILIAGGAYLAVVLANRLFHRHES
ncbi:MAG: metal ABC transporter permease [Thermoguttaceae bacterium]